MKTLLLVALLVTVSIDTYVHAEVVQHQDDSNFGVKRVLDQAITDGKTYLKSFFEDENPNVINPTEIPVEPHSDNPFESVEQPRPTEPVNPSEFEPTEANTDNPFTPVEALSAPIPEDGKWNAFEPAEPNTDNPFTSVEALNAPQPEDGKWNAFEPTEPNTDDPFTSVEALSAPKPEDGKWNAFEPTEPNTDDPFTSVEALSAPKPVDGKWSEFGDWSPCSKSCGRGVQKRLRSCSEPYPTHGGKPCQGEAEETRSCNTKACPIDGGWGDFFDWSPCTRSCGTGSQTRTRLCNNPKPEHGGLDCLGASFETRKCGEVPCPVHGQWTEFSSWSLCSKSCNGGTQSRVRSCTNPSPKYGGRHCLGDDSEHRECNQRPCPVNGGWSSFTPWTLCTKICGGGIQRRFRTCTNPSPQNGGEDCHGDSQEEQQCNLDPCPIDGGWSDFTEWSNCTKQCGGGTQERSRKCVKPIPQHGGKQCDGVAKEHRECNLFPCSEEKKTSSSNDDQYSARVIDRFGLNTGTSGSNNPEIPTTDTALFRTYESDTEGTQYQLIKEPTAMPVHVNMLPYDAKVKIKRRRRSSDDYSDERPNAEAQGEDCTFMGPPHLPGSNCIKKPFYMSIAFYFAVGGWSLLTLVVGLYLSFKCGCGDRFRRLKSCGDNGEDGAGVDIESGVAEIVELESPRTSVKGRRGTGYPRDHFEVITEYDEDGVPVPPDPSGVRPSLKRYVTKHDRHVAERRRIIKKVTFTPGAHNLRNQLEYAKSVIIGGTEREKSTRKSDENRSLIRGHSSMHRRQSMVDQLRYARSVILEPHHDSYLDKRATENRKLIRRHSDAYSGSLNSDVLSYASQVLVHRDDERQHDHMAFERRKIIREGSQELRRGSLSDEIMFAQSVILPDENTRDLDREAHDRRSAIKSNHRAAGASGRRMSLQDDILIAQAIIAPDRVDEGNIEARENANITLDHSLYDWV